MKKGLTEIVFILDKSGSMSGLEDDTIGGYNSFLEKQKKEEGEAVISTVLFSTDNTVVHNRVDIKKVEKLTDKDYQVGGCTALLDAVGSSICHIVKVHKAMKEEERPEKTIFVITTDGQENSSEEFTYQNLKSLIEKETDKYGWEFIFLGANIDAVKEGAKFGIKRDHASNYTCDSVGTRMHFDCVCQSISGMRKGNALQKDWNKEILNYNKEKEEKKNKKSAKKHLKRTIKLPLILPPNYNPYN